MSASYPHQEPEAAGLARMLPAPAIRDLQADRQNQLKEHLMSELRAVSPWYRNIRRPRASRATVMIASGLTALAASAVAATLGVLGQQAGPAIPPSHPGLPLSNPGSAVLLLSKIAKAAEHSPAPKVRDSQYVYIKSWVAWTSEGPSGSKLETPHERQIWIPVADLCRPVVIHEQGIPQGVKAATIPGEKCPDRGYLNDPTYRLLQTLPTDPHALLALINKDEKGAGSSPDEEAFTTIGDLLDESIAPPKVSAALYRAAALIPGVTVEAHLVDALGRSGVAVAFSDFGTRTEWIFDSKTLQWLGEREVGIGHGKLTGEQAIQVRAIVDHAGELPKTH
jgi:hypothetical protein